MLAISQNFGGNCNDISIVDMEGTLQTAGTHVQCLLTSKELTKVKTSRDARLAVIHWRTSWVIRGLGELREKKYYLLG